jgi:hypothetical protein
MTFKPASSGTAAVDLLGQFAPREVLEKARALALQIERDEFLREYLARRSVVIVAVAVAAMMAGFVVIGAAAMSVLPWAGQQAFWLRATLVLCAGALWCAAVVVPTALFLARLEGHATRERDAEASARK